MKATQKNNFFAVIVALFCFSNTQGQNFHFSEKDSIKVGVVLSGGGAKGLAHIGALRVIEEAGVKIDYIAGTSMGAIIGGLYASGYSPNQLDSIFEATNFSTLIRDDLPREAKTFFEKKESEKYGISLPFDGFKLSIPSGLSKGQNVFNFFAQLTAHIQVENFSEMPIPYFCMATDLETGEQVILDQGSLPQSMLASGSIPSVFRPILINDRLLTDGGVINNYPVEEMRSKGVDIIIGVDVQDELYTREKLNSALEIMSQINHYRMINAMRYKKDLTDVMISPDITNFSVLGFDKGAMIIANGEKAAREKLTVLEEIASIQLQNKHAHERMHIRPKEEVFINEIFIKGNNDYPRGYVRGKLKLDQNEKITFTEINKGLNNLSATRNFNHINYRLIPVAKDTYDFELEVQESNENTLLRFGVHYDDLYKSGILLNLTRKSIFTTNDIFSIDLVAGDNLRYQLDYFVDKGRYWSIGFSSRFNQFQRNVDFSFVNQTIGGVFENTNINKIQIVNQDLTNRLYLETYLNKEFKFGLGLEQKFLNAKTETITNNTSDDVETIIEEFNLLSSYAYLHYDTLDDLFYPTKGFSFYSDFNLYWFSFLSDVNVSQFSIVKSEVTYVHPIGNKWAISYSTELGFRIGNEDLAGLNFFLGGFGNKPINNLRPFYGYDFISLSGNSYIKAGVDIQYEFIPKNYLIGHANYAHIGNHILSSGDWLSSPDFSGYALGYGVKTLFGPIDVKYSYSPELKSSIWYFSLGYRF
jgi:NTE family protein